MNDLTDDEWQAWFALTPQERWAESMKLWDFYLAMGGSLDPEYDPQSPFNNDYYPDGPPADEPPYVSVNRSGDRNATSEQIDYDAPPFGEAPPDEDEPLPF